MRSVSSSWLKRVWRSLFRSVSKESCDVANHDKDASTVVRGRKIDAIQWCLNDHAAQDADRSNQAVLVEVEWYPAEPHDIPLNMTAHLDDGKRRITPISSERLH